MFKFPYTGDDWRSTLQAFGTILGRQKKAAQVIEELEHKITDARDHLARTARHEKVAVLRISAKAIYMYGGGVRGYTGPLLYEGLGLAEPSLVERHAHDERRINLTPEGLANLDAHHLFITFDNEDGEGEGRELLDTPLWKSLDAVQGNRVYEVDFLAWMNYGVLSHSRKIDDVMAILG